MSEAHELTVFCPFYQKAVELLGSRWTGAVVRALSCDLYRFNDLRQAVPGLSDRMLSERLKELESEGVVRRSVIPETPVRVEYRLTEKGLALREVIDSISHWADVWVADTETTLSR